MEKVKVTQEQADAIEWQKEEARRAHERFKRNHQCDLDEQLYTLLELSTEDYMKASFTVGYEVEPEFKVGDWVTYKYWGLVGKVYSLNGGVVLDNRKTSALNPTDFRHSTPEEIAEEKQHRWWAKQGRDVWELKRDDLLMNRGGTIFEVENVTEKEIELWTIHKPIGKQFLLEYIKRNFKVICFAEDRKDA